MPEYAVDGRWIARLVLTKLWPLLPVGRLVWLWGGFEPVAGSRSRFFRPGSASALPGRRAHPRQGCEPSP